jgi:hypothetical protein
MIPWVFVDVDTATDRAMLVQIAEATVLWSIWFGKPPPYGWGLSASVRVASGPKDVLPGEWPLLLVSHADVPGAEGYHSRAPNGRPYARVFPLLLTDDSGAPLTGSALRDALAGVITHEVGEAMANPELNRVAAVPRPDGTLPMEESSDNVETFSFPVTIASGEQVMCSAYTTPAYFEPPDDMAGVPVAVGAPGITQPGQMVSGSYQILYDPATRQYTQDQRGELSPYRQALADRGWNKLARLNARVP